MNKQLLLNMLTHLMAKQLDEAHKSFSDYMKNKSSDLLNEDHEKEWSSEKMCKSITSMYKKLDPKHKKWCEGAVGMKDGVSWDEAVKKLSKDKADKIIHKLKEILGQKPTLEEEYNKWEADMQVADSIVSALSERDLRHLITVETSYKLHGSEDADELRELVMTAIEKGVLNLDQVANFAHSSADMDIVHESAKHNHGPNFGKKVKDCPRCEELSNGAEPTRWSGSSNKEREKRRNEEIRNHKCDSKCGPVCTKFDW